MPGLTAQPQCSPAARMQIFGSQSKKGRRGVFARRGVYLACKEFFLSRQGTFLATRAKNYSKTALICACVQTLRTRTHGVENLPKNSIIWQIWQIFSSMCTRPKKGPRQSSNLCVDVSSISSSRTDLFWWHKHDGSLPDGRVVWRQHRTLPRLVSQILHNLGRSGIWVIHFDLGRAPRRGLQLLVILCRPKKKKKKKWLGYFEDSR